MSATARPDVLAGRVAALEALFRDIGATRMRGVPMLHPGLAVQAVGFEAADGGALGVLMTPWFMNLVWLPADDACPLPVGTTLRRSVGHEDFDFIAAHEPGFGAFEACSLFSPMFEFADQAAALSTAEHVLAILRAPPPAHPTVPSRRALLFGRDNGAAP
jgi:[NiFe] hydrogenase assembly HybE family chaperone